MSGFLATLRVGSAGEGESDQAQARRSGSLRSSQPALTTALRGVPRNRDLLIAHQVEWFRCREDV